MKYNQKLLCIIASFIVISCGSVDRISENLYILKSDGPNEDVVVFCPTDRKCETSSIWFIPNEKDYRTGRSVVSFVSKTKVQSDSIFIQVTNKQSSKCSTFLILEKSSEDLPIYGTAGQYTAYGPLDSVHF